MTPPEEECFLHAMPVCGFESILYVLMASVAQTEAKAVREPPRV
jgi:hypothetical protein